MPRAVYVMVGGFLGAGKSTAIVRLARHLTERGRAVGLITNDQGAGLVDTALARSTGLPVEEITGGCFCCRFTSLMEAAERLTAAARPDVFLAEPVGSCTDLRATVSYPLRRLYGDDYAIAPLSVLVDPFRALRVLGLESGRSFSDRVLYVYDRQMAEADLIVINKSDLLDDARLERLRAGLTTRYPGTEIVVASARTGEGLEDWFTRIMASAAGTAAAPDVDYEIYAEGEAALGWFNATVRLGARAPFDGNGTLERLAASMRAALEASEIAHLKMTLTPDEDGADLGVLNLVSTEGRAELAHELKAPLDAGELIVNIRAEADPERLRDAALEALTAWAADEPGRETAVVHLEHFRPSRPVPTHRWATA